MFLVKILAGLAGLVAMLGGVGAFGVGLWLGLKSLLYHPSGPHLVGAAIERRPETGTVVACIAGGIIAIYLGTQLGRFARGDFD